MAAMVRAQSRWVVTGTPIGSGGLTDLHGLLRVLQHDPFQDRQLWQACVARPYARGMPLLHLTLIWHKEQSPTAANLHISPYSGRSCKMQNGASWRKGCFV